MTEKQIYFIQTWFEDEKIPQWKSISNKLIRDGEVIIGGNSKLWLGGIGNFIETVYNGDMINCVRLKFDAEAFLKSCIFEERIHQEIKDKMKRLDELTKEIKELEELRWN